MMEWIAMSDRAPDFGVPVLFYFAPADLVFIGDWRQDGCFWTTDKRFPRVPSEYVTHWAALVPPKLSSEERDRVRRLPPDAMEAVEAQEAAIADLIREALARRDDES